MMGPYMSPIPANASAAMIFSFFVAVMVTPWLMLKFGGKARRPRGAWRCGRRHPRPRLCRRRPAHPQAARRAPGSSCCSSASRRSASLALFYTQATSRSSCCPSTTSRSCRWSSTCRKAPRSRTPTASLQAGRRDRARRMPEVVSVQTYAGDRRALQLQRPRAPLLPAHRAGAGRRAGQPVAEGRARAAPATRSRSNCASSSKALDAARRAPSIKVVEPPPGPPVLATLLAEIYGPDAETRRAIAAKVREAFDSRALHRRHRRQLRPADAARARRHRPGQSRIPRRSRRATSTTRCRASTAATTVGYSHRGGGRQPIPITRRPAEGATRVIDERALSTPVPANALPGDRGVVELGDVVSVSAASSRPSRSSATTAGRPRW